MNIQTKHWYRVIWAYLLPACVLAIMLLLSMSDRRTVRGAGPTYIPGAQITDTVTWTLDGSPYIVTDSVRIEPTGILTIEPGVEVRFEADTALEVLGRLVAVGTMTRPITFTSNLTVPAPGDWRGLEFITEDSQGRLAWCDVGYGGRDMPGYPSLSIRYSSDVQVEHCRIHHGATGGVSIFESRVRLTDVQVEHHQGHGIIIEGFSTQPTLENVSIANNQGAAVWQASHIAYPTYRNLTVTANLTDAIIIARGEVSSTTVWDFAPAGVPVYVGGDIGIANQTLSIGPGTTLQFITNTQLVIMGGELYALGTPTAPITFTGLFSRPASWGGISVQGGRAIFRYCNLEYGGAQRPPPYGNEATPLLEITSDDVTLQYCRIHHGAGDGIRTQGQPTIVFSQIYSNAQVYSDTFGLRAGPLDIDLVIARYNWWGHSSGPHHPTLNPDGLGEPITGNVVISPWLTSPAGEIAQDFVILINGPGTISPGGTEDYVISYLNRTARPITVPLVVALPEIANLVSSSTGVYWPERHELVVRPEGGIAPGQEGSIWIQLQFEWGLDRSVVHYLSAFLLSELPNFQEVLTDYVNYTPTTVLTTTVLSEQEFNALRQASPDFETLYTRAISEGMIFGAAQRLELSNGDVFTEATLMDLQRGSTMYIRVPVSGTVLASRFEPPSTHVLLDATGGVTRNLETETWTYWGSWADQAGAASIQRMGFSKCLRNCLVPRLTLGFVTKRFKALSFILDGLDCISCGKGDRYSCLKCAAALKGVPWVGEALDFAECFDDCRTDPSKYTCITDRVACFYHDQPYAFNHRGNVKYVYPPASEIWECNWWGNLVFKGFDFCTQSSCTRCIPDYGCLDPCASAPDPEECCHEKKQLSAGVPRDPNAKYGPSGDLLPGQWVTYTIEYENEGEGTAYGVFILDTLSEHFDDTTLTLTGNGFYITPTRTLVWPIGQVAPKGEPGSSGAVTFTVRLKPDLPGGTLIMNQAVVHFPTVPEETPTNVVINVIAPVSAEPQTVRTGAMQPVSITLRGRDVGNAPLTYTLASEPLYGRLSGTPPALTYSPMENFVGADRFTFKVSNGITESRPAEVMILVEPSAYDTISPQVRWTEPTSGAVGLPVMAVLTDTLGPLYAPFIYVQFSEPMSATTITSQTFQLLDEGGRPLSATVTYDGMSYRARLQPREPLRKPGMYTGRVSAGVTDASGNPLGTDYTWRFWTERYRLYLPVVLRQQP